MSFAGPKLGSGPRWNLRGAVGGKNKVEKEAVERELALMKQMMQFISSEVDQVVWEEMGEELEGSGCLEPGDQERIEEIFKDASGAGTTRAYIEQLEAEIRMLRAGSDARCTGMLRQALSGSEDADVDFVFDGGQIGGVKGHRGMLCAGSEEYAGLFRSGMVEAQEGKIRVPPCVGTESFRGFLEWLYLGEVFAVC